MKNKLLFFFLFSLIISLIFWTPMLLDKLGIINFKIPLILGQTLGTLSVLASLFIIQKLDKSFKIKDIFLTIKKNKTSLKRLILSASFIPLSVIIGILLNNLLLNQDSNILNPEIFNSTGLMIIPLIFITLIAGLLSSPLLEEPGWRGFALPLLEKKYGSLIASFLLGTYWWIWHITINLVNNVPVTFIAYILMLIQSFTIDSLYNINNKNLLAAMLSHSSLIITFTYLNYSQSIGLIISELIFLIILRKNKLN